VSDLCFIFKRKLYFNMFSMFLLITLSLLAVNILAFGLIVVYIVMLQIPTLRNMKRQNNHRTMKWKGFGRKRSLSNRNDIPIFIRTNVKNVKLSL
jgi:hypothetical protein